MQYRQLTEDPFSDTPEKVAARLEVDVEKVKSVWTGVHKEYIEIDMDEENIPEGIMDGRVIVEPKHDTSYTDEVVCPHCGHECMDSYEFFSQHEECTEIDCDDCGKTFSTCRSTTTYYRSSCLSDEHTYVDDPSRDYPDHQTCSTCGETRFKRYIRD